MRRVRTDAIVLTRRSDTIGNRYGRRSRDESTQSDRGGAGLGRARGSRGCGGGGSSDSTTTASGSTSAVLRIGTVNYIDSLNPFNYVEAQSTNAMIMIYPQLVQYGVGMKFEGDWATSWETSSDGKDWTFHLKPDTKWSDGKPLTAADAAWTINTTVKYADDATAVAAAAPRTRQERRGARRDDARDPLRVAGRERPRPARDVLRPARARLGAEGRR